MKQDTLYKGWHEKWIGGTEVINNKFQLDALR
jgi:hypothetical protein